jgi:lipoate synthase
LRASLQGGNLSSEAWSGVRQLILLRTKRKAAEAALNSFMLAGGGGESEQIRQEPAPVSTLVLNCFVDVIGQQVRRLGPSLHVISQKQFFRLQEFYPNTMSVALEEFYHVLASMQVNSSFCAFCCTRITCINTSRR